MDWVILNEQINEINAAFESKGEEEQKKVVSELGNNAVRYTEELSKIDPIFKEAGVNGIYILATK